MFTVIAPHSARPNSSKRQIGMSQLGDAVVYAGAAELVSIEQTSDSIGIATEYIEGQGLGIKMNNLGDLVIVLKSNNGKQRTKYFLCHDGRLSRRLDHKCGFDFKCVSIWLAECVLKKSALRNDYFFDFISCLILEAQGLMSAEVKKIKQLVFSSWARNLSNQVKAF